MQEIRTLSNGAVWRHIPGTENPADLPSRGCSSSQLITTYRWWEGPNWLKLPRNEWPTEEIVVDEQEVSREIKKGSMKSMILLNESRENESKVYLRYFSHYGKIVKMVAWINRFLTNSRIKEKEKRNMSNYISSQEIRIAENLLLKLVQREMFVNEKSDKLKSLNVLKDDFGLLRLKTKIFYRNDSENFRCPILLNSSHKIVPLIILEEHYNDASYQ